MPVPVTEPAGSSLFTGNPGSGLRTTRSARHCMRWNTERTAGTTLRPTTSCYSTRRAGDGWIPRWLGELAWEMPAWLVSCHRRGGQRAFHCFCSGNYCTSYPADGERLGIVQSGLGEGQRCDYFGP